VEAWRPRSLKEEGNWVDHPFVDFYRRQWLHYPLTDKKPFNTLRFDK